MKRIFIVFFLAVAILSFSGEKIELEEYNIELKEILIKNRLEEYKIDKNRNKKKIDDSYYKPLVKYLYKYYDFYDYYQKRMDELEKYKSNILKKLNTPKGFDIEIGMGKNIKPYYEIKYEFIMDIDLDKIIKGELR